MTQDEQIGFIPETQCLFNIKELISIFCYISGIKTMLSFQQLQKTSLIKFTISSQKNS